MPAAWAAGISAGSSLQAIRFRERCGWFGWPERTETQMHLKKIIELIAEQAARETAKRATGDAPGAVFSRYTHRGCRSTTGFIRIVAIAVRLLAGAAFARYHGFN